MTFGLPMSDDVWQFFVEDADGGVMKCRPNDSMLSEWEWNWLKQVDELPRGEVDLSDPFAPVVQFTLRCNEYWVAMRPSSDFPRHPPAISCAYKHGFSFDWYSGEDIGEKPSSLVDLVKSYREYCEVLDSAILQIKLLDNEVSTIIGYSLDEDDSECFTVKLCPKAVQNETITILVDWQRPLEFPKYISSTDERRFSNLDCEIWDVSDELHLNMKKIIDGPCGEDD